jgi:hypothetical protein
MTILTGCYLLRKVKSLFTRIHRIKILPGLKETLTHDARSSKSSKSLTGCRPGKKIAKG